ncbi:MAG: type II secretion system F family protein [Endomicrobium sp.]|jgi:tight adherence protein C|nr:type II secretion system F family protein [Endomicrobium sp.]
MIILFCLFLSFTVFFSVYYAVSNLKKAELAGKIKNAVEKKNKPRIFGITYFYALVDKLAVVAGKVKYKRFVSFVEKNGRILKLAGRKYENITPYKFFAVQISIMSAGMLFTVFFLSLNVLVIVCIGLLCFYLPVLKIKEELKKRKESIIKELPEMADLFSVMLATGIDFYGAAGKIVTIMSGTLIDELKNAVAKISLGYDKKTAFNEMAENTGVEQVRSFVNIINIALESGTEMSDTLKRISSTLRNERFAYAQKKAHEAPIKMLIPLVLLIFPTIFIVIFGPIAINFMKNGF